VRQKGFVPILVLIVVILIVVGTYFLATSKLPKFHTTPSLSATPSVSDETSNWKTYENLAYRIRFKYPVEFSIEELPNLGPNYMQINILGQTQKAQAIFMIKTSYGQEETASFVGFSPQDTKTINGLTWYFFDFPQGYSNSPPFTVYHGTKADYLYSFKFFNDVTNDFRDKIMATIEILPPPQH
jgi:hypothetical protein